MADNYLFPVFDVPDVVALSPAEEQKYKRSVFFDFERGDFKRDGANKVVTSTGEEAYIHWCIKTVLTERLSCLSYSADIGTELEDAFKQADRKAVESAIERTISEALMINPKTEYIRSFEFNWTSDGLHCSFIIKGKEWEEKNIGLNVQT